MKEKPTDGENKERKKGVEGRPATLK